MIPQSTGPGFSSQRTDEMFRFFRHLFAGVKNPSGDLYLCIATGKRDPETGEIPEDGFDNRFYRWPTEQRDAAKRALRRADAGYEVYVGTHLLKEKSRKKKAAATVRALWADLDGAQIPDGDMPPTCVVESSPGKFHCYWRLGKSLEPQRAEALARALAHEIGADSGWHLGKVLRVPGTFNHKYGDPRVVGVRIIDPAREVDPASLPQPQGSAREKPQPVGGDPRGGPPVRLRGDALARWHGDKSVRREDGSGVDRSRTLFAIARDLHRANATEDVIAQALQERDQTFARTGRFGEGAKYADRPEWYSQTASNATGGLGVGTHQQRDRKMANEDPREVKAGEYRRPEIVVYPRDQKDVLTDTSRAVVAANVPPTMFVRDGRLSKIARDEDGTANIQIVTVDGLRSRMAHAANFVRVDRKNQSTPTTPPKEIAQMLFAEGDWPDLPPLIGLSGVPVLRPDGAVHDSPGYDAMSRIFYDAGPGGELPPKVPPEPSDEDMLEARGLLDKVLGDFPFATETDRANAWGLLLTPIARPWTPGPVPLALIDKPKMGSGGSLLAEVVSTVATGNAPFLGAPTSEEEWSKVITSSLLAGLPVLTFDNIEEKIRSSVLSRALTSPLYADRLLGTNTIAHLPQRSTWIATGNNIAVGGDLPRRCYRIRLDPKHPKPWQRSDFKIPELASWVQGRRGELVSALLTLCVAWHNAGRPRSAGGGDSRKRIGGFEGWDRTISGILENAEVGGFLGNLDEFYESADEEGGEWEAFLAAWHEHIGDRALPVKDLVGRFGTQEGMRVRDALPAELADAYEHNHSGFTRKLGNALAKHSGARYGDEGYHALMDGESKRAKLWRVAKDR